MKIKVRVKKKGNTNTTTADFDKNAKSITIIKNNNSMGSKIKKVTIKSAVPISKINGIDISKFLRNIFG